jgi:hypothetical protein
MKGSLETAKRELRYCGYLEKVQRFVIALVFVDYVVLVSSSVAYGDFGTGCLVELLGNTVNGALVLFLMRLNRQRRERWSSYYTEQLEKENGMEAW